MVKNIKELTPAFAIHPGKILHDELTSREIKQKEFADLIGIHNTQLNEIIKGKRAINADIALLIGKALNMDAILWLNLQSSYDLELAKVNEKNSARLAALDQWEMIKNYIPHKYFKKEGLLSGIPIMDIPVVKNIYAVENFDQLAGIYSRTNYARFRKSEKLTIDKINLIGWVKLVNYKASKIQVAKFNENYKHELIAELNNLFRKNKKTVEKTIETLAKYGIKLIVQSNPEKCAVDGISFWSKGTPAIGISLRLKRIDNFAFTIMHELGHVFLHLTNNNEAEFIDIDYTHDTIEHKKDTEEKEANEFAKNGLIENEKWEYFIRNNFSYSEPSIISFAAKEKTHPAIVLGRYCHEIKKYAFKTTIDKAIY